VPSVDQGAISYSPYPEETFPNQRGFPICWPLGADYASFCRIRQASEGSNQPLALPTGAF